MIIKTADDQTEALAQLERRASGADSATRKRIEEELRARRAGIKGEAESAHLINFHFGDSKNWAVIHDLRLEVDDQVAQIDHLMINRWLECYVLETKRFHAGVKINEEGEFERWNAFRNCYEGMPSPLLQNQRHIEVLRRAAEELEMPTRLGLRMALHFETLILVSPSARIMRPTKFDTSRVIKADQLKERVWKDIDSESLLKTFAGATKLVFPKTVMDVARQIARLHTPLRSPETAPTRAVADPVAVSRAGPPSAGPPSGRAEPPACKKCAGQEGQILYGRYGYYFKCSGCSTNTAVRIACKPGHNPRIRKQGQQFLRECPECGASELYFHNT